MAMGGHESARAETTTWLTPRLFIDALGPFDLDPCAAPSPRPWATAAEHIELPRDGLSEPWHGRVWLNPPYGREAGAWVARLAAHGCGTLLIFARTETEWFERVWDTASGIMFLRRRVTFCYPDGTPGRGNSGAPSVLVSFGPDDAERLRTSGLSGKFIAL